MKTVTKTPRELCEERVRRGIVWLNENAPDEWVKNLFVVRETDSRIQFIADDMSENACVLALAFRGTSFRGWMGHVTFNAVRAEFNLSKEACWELGFCASASAESATEDAFLGEIWEQLLQPMLLQTLPQTEPGEKSAPIELEGESGLY